MMSKINSSQFSDLITNVLENRDNSDETLSMIAELKDIIENAENILDVMKNKPRAFFQYNDLVKMNSAMKWKLPKDLHDIPNFDPQIIKVPDYMLELIKEESPNNRFHFKY